MTCMLPRRGLLRLTRDQSPPRGMPYVHNVMSRWYMFPYITSSFVLLFIRRTRSYPNLSDVPHLCSLFPTLRSSIFLPSLITQRTLTRTKGTKTAQDKLRKQTYHHSKPYQAMSSSAHEYHQQKGKGSLQGDENGRYLVHPRVPLASVVD
jgi:hypothetical protein